VKKHILWHKENLAADEWVLERDEEALEKLQERVNRIRVDVAFRRQQIEEAERRGLSRFDAGRLLVKRKKKED
jgi:hypothetical protein